MARKAAFELAFRIHRYFPRPVLPRERRDAHGGDQSRLPGRYLLCPRRLCRFPGAAGGSAGRSKAAARIAGDQGAPRGGMAPARSESANGQVQGSNRLGRAHDRRIGRNGVPRAHRHSGRRFHVDRPPHQVQGVCMGTDPLPSSCRKHSGAGNYSATSISY